MKAILLLLILLNNIFVIAQEDSIYTLDSVIVSSTRGTESLLNLPYNISYADKNTIQQGETRISLSELPGIAGLEINNRNNFSLGDKIIMRGVGARSSFGVRGVKILYDGIPLTMPDGQSQLNNIDLSSAGRIEILKGPVSSLYGNSAGGIITIESENAPPDPISAELSFIPGSFGLQKYLAKSSGSLGNTSYMVSFNKFNYKGYREHSSAASSSVNAVIKNIFSNKLLLKTVINYFDSPYMQNPSSLNRTDAERNPSGTRSIVIQQGAGEKTTQLHGGVTLNYINNNLNVESTVYYLKRKIKNPIPGRIIELERSAGGLRNTAGYSLTAANHEINIKGGLDIEFQEDERAEFENSGLLNVNIDPQEVFSNLIYGTALLDQDESAFNAAPFFSLEILIDKFRLSGGLRYDYYKFKAADNFLSDLSDNSGSRLMTNLSHMAGLVYRPDDCIKFYFNYSTSFLTPTANELSNNPDGRGGFNQSLLPEKVLSMETGMQAAWNKFSLSAAVYIMNFYDMLIPYQSINSDEVFYRNAGKARNIGAEIAAEYYISEWLQLALSYTNLNFTFSDYIVQTEESGLVQLKGNEIPGIPAHTLGLSAIFAYDDFYSKILFSGNEEFYANDFNGPAPGVNDNKNNYINPSVIELNVRAGYNISFPSFSIGLFAGVNNVFNHRYFASIVPNAAGNRFFEPSPVRNWYAGIRGGI